MGIFNFFRSRRKGSSAQSAKERLQVVIAHERADRDGPDYLPLLKQDLLNVIKKYVDIDEEQLKVQLDSQDDCDVLELNITLPEAADAAGADDSGGASIKQPSAAAQQAKRAERAAAAATPPSRARRTDSGKAAARAGDTARTKPDAPTRATAETDKKTPARKNTRNVSRNTRKRQKQAATSRESS